MQKRAPSGVAAAQAVQTGIPGPTSWADDVASRRIEVEWLAEAAGRYRPRNPVLGALEPGS